MDSQATHRLLTFSGAAWIALIVGGYFLMARHELVATARATPPSHWPAGTLVAAPHDRPVLMVFAHPQCPCTRSSMNELARIMCKGKGKISTYVFFVKPDDRSEEWVHTEAYRTARDTPGVCVKIDAGGREARRFGAETSGQALMYDKSGALVFSGGITGSRAHEGDSTGKQAILKVISGTESGFAATEVFGCPLHSPICKTKGAQ